MAKTELIRAALMTDLTAVAGLTPYAEEIDTAKRVTPSAELLEGGIGESEADEDDFTLTGLCGRKSVEVPIRLTTAAGDAPWTTIANLIDSVTNQIEDAASTLRAVAGVGLVVVTYESPGRAEGFADGTMTATLTVRFGYEYAQGSQ